MNVQRWFKIKIRRRFYRNLVLQLNLFPVYSKLIQIGCLEQAGWGFRSKSRCILKYLCGELEVVLEVGTSTRKSEITGML
jgi:hypothetical protein